MAPSPPEPPSGLLLVDKPAGISSNGLVQRIRRAVGRSVRVGHAGTLDPFATGLMLVLLGRGTKIAQFLVGLDKGYETVAQLGARSTTGDPEGEIEWTGRVPASPLALPTGEVVQRPPAYSAIKIDGERAYRRARRGEEVDVPERLVTVHAFEELGRDAEVVRLRLRCSSGTYVRSLVADLGDGYCLELRRTAVGPWTLDDAAPLGDLVERPELIRERCIPIDRALPGVAPLELPREQVQDVRHGRKIPLPDLAEQVEVGATRLVADAHGAVAVVTSDGDVLRTVVGFRA